MLNNFGYQQDRIKTSIGKRTLGVCLAPDGSFTQEFAHRQEQAITWVRNITNAPLTSDKVYTTYCSMWRPSFEFPLPITCFSKQQCCTLQKIFTSPFLSKMGISIKTSRKLIFAPYHYSGFAFADTWVQQGLQYLQFLIGHLCHQDQVGNLFQINIDTSQLLLGHPFPPPPHSHPYQDIAAIAPPSWLITTWEFLNDINSQVTFTDPWNLPLDWQETATLCPKYYPS